MAKRNPPVSKYVLSPAIGTPRKTWAFVMTLSDIEAGIREDSGNTDVAFSTPNDHTVVFTPLFHPEDATKVRSSRSGISRLLRVLERNEREGLIRRA